MTSTEWVFGYASLVHDGAGGGAVEAQLTGFRRALGVAHDNRRVIPGYKTYFRRDDGTQPEVYVAFFDLEVADAMTVAGLALPVDAARLEALDARELNYERAEVTGMVERVEGRVWTYIGRGAGRARLARGLAEGTAVVSKDYLDKVESAFRARGKAAMREFERTTVDHGIQPMDLDRRDVPEDA